MNPAQKIPGQKASFKCSQIDSLTAAINAAGGHPPTQSKTKCNAEPTTIMKTVPEISKTRILRVLLLIRPHLTRLPVSTEPETQIATIAELAECEGIAPSYMTRVLRLMLLAPYIVEAILDGRQGPEVTLARVLEPFPLE